MNELITFFIELILVSASFCLGYFLIKNHTTPWFLRFYLLAWLICSVAFPLVSIESNQSPDLNIGQMVRESSNRPKPNEELNKYHDLVLSEDPTKPIASFKGFKNEANREIDWGRMILGVYLLVTVFFLLRVIVGILQIVRLKVKADLINENDAPVYEVQDSSFKGASFFGWIFIGKSVQSDRDLVIRHERIHHQQLHSLDILVSAIYCAVFWLNPLSWFLKKIICLNTELEVDAYILRSEDKTSYANILLSLSQSISGSKLMNHFGAFHLKSRVIALTRSQKHRKWVSIFSLATILVLFFTVSCEKVATTEVIIEAQLNDVKKITTRFISHQSDTQQKTGKIVSVATFLPDGLLDEFVTQTTYPYDREFEEKKEFWDQPIRSNLFYIMDGLSMGVAEKNLLYGNDWPKAYVKYLRKLEMSEVKGKNHFNEKIRIDVDNEIRPAEIKREIVYEESEVFFLGMPDVTEFFVYEGDKVIETAHMNTYPTDVDYDDERFKKIWNFDGKEASFKARAKARRSDEGIRKTDATYTYDGELISSIRYSDSYGDYEYKFYYSNDVLSKSEYYKNEGLISSRFHYYENGLKDRTEIFNLYNEPEYTITYEYEFW